ncbi:MAG: [Fe-S]-binding protein [Desulfovibrio sp.]|jgi:iron only hydrogenase large subunit-like protein|nr:[Fe-S]-binding protein [Desulfovibrio sp.]
MNNFFPVYTRYSGCQDCYKCVRQCPVKAIRVEKQQARITEKRCVACGGCVRVCPAKAKMVRNDLGRARRLLFEPLPVYASIAPSWIASHPDWSTGQLAAALRLLGFTGVSETALGAQEVSAALACDLEQSGPGLHISSACPAVVDLVRKHLPHLVGNITPVASPALTHCRLLRERLGRDVAVVFIGPCAAKKNEADDNPDLMNLALTFAELDEWLTGQGIFPARLQPGVEDRFFPRDAAEGALYPVEGGMIETLRHYGCPDTVRYQALSGLQYVKTALERLGETSFAIPFFLEALACHGGCISGPCPAGVPSPLEGILAIRSRVSFGPEGRRQSLRVGREYSPAAAAATERAEDDIKKALSRVGKTKPGDELNCGGCGYETCRQFAGALLSGDAETAMCVSYMRGIAQRKANALLSRMPSGVAVAGEDLRIVESNGAFANLFGEPWVSLRESIPGLAGVALDTLFPFESLLRAVLRSGRDIRRERLTVGKKFLSAIIFSIEEHKTVGVILEDVTLNAARREQIASRAREVIDRNIAAVQEIASRLGEHVADTEILLNSIARDFGDADEEEQ